MPSSANWPCAALSGVELAARTTVRVGGPAEWLLEPANPDELVAGYTEARERGLEVHLLGGGANLLIDDAGVPGCVITTARMARVFRPHRYEEGGWMPEQEDADEERPFDPTEPPVLVAWAGAPLPGLCRAARELGWSGIEGLVGVPGHVGGGVTMNAGGRWGEFWDVIDSVRLLHRDGELEDRAAGDCDPGYRDARLGDAIVLGAVLHLEASSKPAVQAAMKQYLFEKSAAQPVTERSSGCVFKNPDPELSDGRSAGRLVDECGAKGRRRGGAMVSPKHGNFIINTGGATSADVLGLIEEVRAVVHEVSGVELASEVRRLGHGHPA